MTLTLEKHFGDRVALRPLSTFQSGRSYFRRVLLVQEYSGHPVEMVPSGCDSTRSVRSLRSQILKNKVPARPPASGWKVSVPEPCQGLPLRYAQHRNDGCVLDEGAPAPLRSAHRGRAPWLEDWRHRRSAADGLPLTMATAPEQYDGIVVGGGPAGATAATVLAQHGHRVLLLERDHFPATMSASR